MRGIVIVIGGIAHTIPEWAEISGVGPKTISRRIDRASTQKKSNDSRSLERW